MFSPLLNKDASVFGTATFRLAFVFALVFGVGAALLLLAIDIGISRFAEIEMKQALTHQMEVMRADADLEGTQALANILNEQARLSSLQRYTYFVVHPTGEILVQGLPPKVRGVTEFALITDDFPSFQKGASNRPTEIMVLTNQARDGGFLAVGRDTAPLESLRRHLHAIAFWGGIGFLLLAMFAGLLAGHLFLRRLEEVNASAARIMSGHPSERLPPIGFGREFNNLAANLNLMLDRQEATINALHQVSEDIAHDLRTPLNRLRNRLEEAAEAPPAVADEMVQIAISEADELLAIIQSLLMLAKLEGGGIAREFTRLDAGDIVQSLVQIYQPSAEESGHTLRLDVAQGAVISGHETLLTQMLSNLLDNALTHTPSGTLIDVTVSIEADGIKVAVSDNGPGVPEEHQDAIFRRFHRLEPSRTTPGAGLGLPLVSAMATLHGASITVDDNEPGFRIEVLFPNANGNVQS